MICCFHLNKRQLLTKTKTNNLKLTKVVTAYALRLWAMYFQIWSTRDFIDLFLSSFLFQTQSCNPKWNRFIFQVLYVFFFYFHLQVLFSFPKFFAERFLSLATLTSISVHFFVFDNNVWAICLYFSIWVIVIKIISIFAQGLLYGIPNNSLPKRKS